MRYASRGNPSFLNLAAAQFLGAINDHIFRMAVSLFAISAAAGASGSSYLSLTTALFVLPYLMFSSYAGHLADIASKSSMLKTTKFAEIVIMAAGVAALAHSDGIRGLAAVLFLMAAQSAFFSPAKFGAVPEIVPATRIARANGVLEAMRYGAIILGTAAGGYLMQFWRDVPVRIGAVTVVIAAAGFLCSLGVQRLPPAAARRRWPSNPWSGLLAGLTCLRQTRSLLAAALSLTYFEMVATLVLMNVLLFAKGSLGVSDGAAGVLGAFTACGMAIGAIVYGRLARPEAPLGIAPIAGIGLAAMLFALGISASHYGELAALLAGLGFFGGLFFLPFLTWLQTCARSDERGLVLATNNFLNMAGLLAASGALWLLHDGLGLTPRAIFAVCGATTALFVVAVLTLSADVCRHFMLVIQPQNCPRIAVQALTVLIAAAAIWTLAPMRSASAADSRSTYRITHELWGDIGTLTHRIHGEATETDMTTTIDVRVDLFGFTLHRIRAEWREDWRAGLLRRFSAMTDTNGTRESVEGEAVAEGFAIHAGGEVRLAPADIRPVNPWSSAFVEATCFMSPESGRITRVEIADEGTIPVARAEGSYLHKYRVSGDNAANLYFDSSNRLVEFEYLHFTGNVSFSLIGDSESRVVLR